MADSDIDDRSYKSMSADASESFCEPCISRGKWTAVQGYCMVCREYMCDVCRDVHTSQKMTRDHTILGKDKMPSAIGAHATGLGPAGQSATGASTISVPIPTGLSSSGLSFTGPTATEMSLTVPVTGHASGHDLCVEICKKHHPEIIRFYCEAHGEPGCQDCMTLNHALCSKVRVQDVSHGYKDTTEFIEIGKKLDQFHKELEIMKDALKDNLENVDKAYNTIQDRISKFRKQIEEYLNEIEKQIKTEVEKLKKQQDTEIKQMTAKNKSMISELEDTIGRLHSDDNENTVFVLTKKTNQRLATMESEITHLELARRQQQGMLYHSTAIDNVVSTSTMLGKLLRKTLIEITLINRPQASSMAAVYNQSITADTPKDSKRCWIINSTLLDPNRLVVCDRENNTLKLIDLGTKTVMSIHNTSTQPYGVTTMDIDKVAVTLPQEGKIQMFHYTPVFTRTDEIKVRKGCCGLAYSDGKFAVTYVSPGRVDVIDNKGAMVHAIQPKPTHGKVQLKEPTNVAFGPYNDTVIVSDQGLDKVVEFTLSGQALYTYKHDKMEIPRGLALTADGYMFVCSWLNGCVHLVSPDFTLCKLVISKDEMVKNPVCIAYCDIKHRLYVCSIPVVEDDQNAIQVYDLNA